jgi:hypothetical protein
MSVLPIAFQLYSSAIKKSKGYSHLIAISSAPDLNYARKKVAWRLGCYKARKLGGWKAIKPGSLKARRSNTLSHACPVKFFV